MTATVPDWDARGVLPPCDPSDPTSPARSPFRVSLREFVLDFALNAERLRILIGFLAYRAELHSEGLVEGFQWLDGSFCEDIELIEGRPPGDLDVVTFYKMPLGEDQASLKAANPALFPINRAEHSALKARYSVDAYVKDLDPDPSTLPALIDTSIYWYSMWSHRRDMTWKGYVQVDLSPIEDAAVLHELQNLPALSAFAPPATSSSGVSP